MRGARRNMSWLELGSRIMKLDSLHEAIRNVAWGASKRGLKWYAYRMTEVNKYGGRQPWGQFLWVPKAKLIGHLEVAPPGSGGFIGCGKPFYHSLRWDRPHPLARNIKEVWHAHNWGTYQKGKIRGYGFAGPSNSPEFAHWLEAREVAQREGRKIAPYEEWSKEMSEPFHSTWWRAGHSSKGNPFRPVRCDGCGSRQRNLHQRVDWPMVRDGKKMRAPWYCERCVPPRRSARRNHKGAARPRLVLWGFHPSYGNIPLKLEAYSAAAMKRRQREGWRCAAYAEGDEPTGLRLLAAKRPV
jgi:hypothetical protein